MDLRGVFNSEPKSLFDTVSEAGLCFYLPAYQRPYTWNKKNIDRVFEDVMHGLENSIRNEDAITFIGTILAIHDTKFETIVPHKKGEVPSKVMLVIDGQQRLTTMLIIMTALHDSMKLKELALKKKLDALQIAYKKDAENDKHNVDINNLEWLLDKLNQEIANLRYFSTDTNSNRDKVYRWYPKLIRAYMDCWSKIESGAQYDSPIAAYLHAYNQHVLGCDKCGKYTAFKYNVNQDHVDYDKHQIIVKNLRSIRQHIKAISAGDSDDHDQPTLSELMSGEFRNSFQLDIPGELAVSGDTIDAATSALNLIVFSKYFLGRVCVTYVTVTDEAYAFDMFEALNTTGEPLTSIETFKPKVIEEEGLRDYEASESKKHFDVIDGYLETISDANKKHKETTRIMLAFALAESGEKISKHISDQRRYLLESYRDEDEVTKKGFVKNLSYTTKFYYEEWDKQNPEELNEPQSATNELLLCLEVLREAKHEITVPLLVRYYSVLLDNPGGLDTRQELVKAAKAIVAFFVLWRASHKHTSGIDSVYRDLLKNGFEELGVQPFSRRSLVKPTSKPLRLCLREKLKKKLDATDDNLKDKWLAQAIKVPVYDISRPLTRVMMLAAFNDTCPSNGRPGMVEKGTKGSSTMLSWHQWKQFFDESTESQFTLEHIAPQTLTDEWDQSLLEDGELLGTVGNLTILPSSANTSASNKSWSEKKKYYNALCQESQRNKEKLLGDFSASQKSILEKSQYLGFLDPIAQVEEWTSDFIKERSKNLLSHVWDVFEEWV